MRLVLAAPTPDTASLARIGNSGLDRKGSCRSTHRCSTAMTCSTTAAASINARDWRAATQSPHPPRSNLHSARRHRCAFPQRGFLPWRLSDAGPRRARHPHSSGRHPKPFTKCEKLRVSRTSPLIPYLPTCERTSTCDVMGQLRTYCCDAANQRDVPTLILATSLRGARRSFAAPGARDNWKTSEPMLGLQRVGCGRQLARVRASGLAFHRFHHHASTFDKAFDQRVQRPVPRCDNDDRPRPLRQVDRQRPETVSCRVETEH